MGIGKIDKLRSFLSNRPPLVLFIFCIGLTAIAFISFAYYIKLHKVRNPDVHKDWNTILYNATKINFCTNIQNISKSVVDSVSPSQIKGYKNVSFHLNVLLSIPSILNTDYRVSSFVSTINASMLGYSGDQSNMSVYINFDLATPQDLVCKNKSNCMKSISTCTTVHAPFEVFPTTPYPATCSSHNNKTLPALNIPGYLPDEEGLTSACASSVFVKINHEEQEKLFVYLTMDTRSQVHMRLMYSSYFLFIIIAVVLGFGFLRGGHHHDKKTQNSANSHLLS